MKLKKKHIIIFVSIVAILLLIGYSINRNIPVKTTTANNSTSSIKGTGTNKVGDTTLTDKNNNQKTANSSTPVAPSPKDTPAPTTKLVDPNIEQVKSLMKQLSSENQVSGSQIYIKNNMHFATITFKKDADSKNATEFATKYANLIKTAYNDNNVNVEIVQNEKSIASIILK